MSFRLSIVTINYNNKVGLQRTSSSILSQGACLLNLFEWILIDGASTDGSLFLLGGLPPELNLKLISEPDTGIYNAMNKGIFLSSGSFCLFLNAGDTFYSESSLRELLRLLEGCNDSEVLLFGHEKIYPFFAPSRICAPKSSKSIPYGMPTSHQSIVYKTSVLKQYPFDEGYKLASDYAHLCLLFILNLKFRSYPLTLSSFYLDGVTNTFAGFWRGLQENHEIRCVILGWGLLPVLLLDLSIAIKSLPIIVAASFSRLL